jgi:hypothetical protein
MAGVGSFNRDCRTLYVINMKNNPDMNMEEVVIKHFKEFGKLEYVKVFQDRCYSFLKYELRACAEFAKEALQNQSLDSDECIKIKWSTDDPNPMNQEREMIEKRKKLKQTIEDKGVSTKNLPFNYPKDYKPQDTILPNFIQTDDSKRKEEEEYIKNYYKEYFEKNKIEYQSEDLDYFHYVHSEFKQEKIKEKIQEFENNRYLEQKKLLGNSEYNDSYPNTDNQYSTEYSNYDEEIFKKYANNTIENKNENIINKEEKKNE